MMLVLVSCEFGERCTESYDGVDVMIGQFKWYLLPIEIQRMLPTLIIKTHQPVLFRFFGSFACSREQFKKVNLNEII